MKYYYEVLAQPARADSPSFLSEGIPDLLQEGKEHFNKRSLLAANPKQITEIKIIDDLTVKITFWSESALNVGQVSRSLRVLSIFLIDRTRELNLSSMVLGSRLFKMTASFLGTKEESEIEQVMNNKSDVFKADEQVDDENTDMPEMAKILCEMMLRDKDCDEIKGIKRILVDWRNSR